MGLTFDPQCKKAIDLAKQTVPENSELGIWELMASLYYSANLKEAFPALEGYLYPPQPLRNSSDGQVPLAASLRPIINNLAKTGQIIESELLFKTLIASEVGRQMLMDRGLDPQHLAPLSPKTKPALEWRFSPDRAVVIKVLGSFGRMLTETAPPHGRIVRQEQVIKALMRTLSKMKRHNVILLGQPGTGKSAIIYELARRLYHGDKSIPPKLRDLDIFELSPAFLRSGASMVGQYDERVKSLLHVLQSHPKVILFVDEIHSLLQSGIYDRGPFSDANESFKSAMGRGEIACIGCTTPAEYRRHIEPDKALERRFNIIRLDPPDTETTLAILKSRQPQMMSFYQPLHIPEDILEKAINLTDEYLPSRFQPDKAIQLMDDACAFCMTCEPPLANVTETALMEALEDMVGHKLMKPETLSEPSIFEQLQTRIIGQDTVLRHLTCAFVAGFSDWTAGGRPRGVFVLGGPTGVGKTETAIVLAKLMGHGKEMLIRVDCNTLSGSDYDVSPAIHCLIGTPPGYVGYARGQGGILSRIRDMPECIVLFDEFEKAPAGISQFLLQIIDDGRVEDVDGNMLDFRRAFFIFTTNVGCTYDNHQLGFGQSASSQSPWADDASVKKGLRDKGIGEEFLARINHYFIFNGLDAKAVPEIITRQLESLNELAQLKGHNLQWDDTIVPFLISRWQSRFGVRFLTTILRHRIIEQISIADAGGELKNVQTIRIEVMQLGKTKVNQVDMAGLSTRRREADTLIISLA